MYWAAKKRGLAIAATLIQAWASSWWFPVWNFSLKFQFTSFTDDRENLFSDDPSLYANCIYCHEKRFTYINVHCTLYCLGRCMITTTIRARTLLGTRISRPLQFWVCGPSFLRSADGLGWGWDQQQVVKHGCLVATVVVYIVYGVPQNMTHFLCWVSLNNLCNLRYFLISKSYSSKF